MPQRRFDWHERIKAVEREYWSTRIAVDRLVHDRDEQVKAVTIADARHRLATYFARLPIKWGV